MLRQALTEELASVEYMAVQTILSRREAKFRHAQGLRGRLQLFLRPSPGARGDTARPA
jgi:hypothetical protein